MTSSGNSIVFEKQLAGFCRWGQQSMLVDKTRPREERGHPSVLIKYSFNFCSPFRKYSADHRDTWWKGSEKHRQKKGNICISIFTGQTVTQCLHCRDVYPADLKVSGVDECLAHTHTHRQYVTQGFTHMCRHACTQYRPQCISLRCQESSESCVTDPDQQVVALTWYINCQTQSMT